jgi:uncharacterized protein YndB with AHSA1/START domain
VPRFDDSVVTRASARTVWKILYDPMRFPEWWSGIERAAAGDARGGDADVTLWPDGYPDFALPQRVESHAEDHRVVVSCTVSDLQFDWRLEPVDGGTRVSVHVDIPDAEAAREQRQRDVVALSLRQLAGLAEAEAVRDAPRARD